MLIGIEFLDTAESRIRIVCCEKRKGKFTVTKKITDSFNTPFYKITPKSVKNKLRKNGIKSKDILILMPEGMDRFLIWRDSADIPLKNKEKHLKIQEFIKANESFLGHSKDVSIKCGFTGESGGVHYGVVSSHSWSDLEAVYKAFKGFRIKYILPKMAAFSSMSFTSSEKYTAAMELNKRSLTLAVYSEGILIWLQSFPCANQEYDGSSIVGAALEAVAAARNKYMYPTLIYLMGELAGETGLCNTLNRELEIECELGSNISPEQASYLTLLSIMRGLKHE